MSVAASAHVVARAAMNSMVAMRSPTSSAVPRAGLPRAPRIATARTTLPVVSTVSTVASVVPRAAAAPTDAATATPLATQAPTAIITGARYVFLSLIRFVSSSVSPSLPPAPASRPASQNLHTTDASISPSHSSGLGLNAANALSRSGYHVIMACRDFAKAKRAAQDMGMDPASYTVMHLDLASLDSVRQFADAFKASGRRYAPCCCFCRYCCWIVCDPWGVDLGL